MHKTLPKLIPGDRAIMLIDTTELHSGFADGITSYTCVLQPMQFVEIVSAPEAINRNGTPTPVVAIRAPDTQGIERTLTIELNQLLPIANKPHSPY